MKKNQNQSAKIVMTIFALVISLMLANVVYLGATGKHFISGNNIREYANERGGGQKVKTLYAKRGTIYSGDKEIIASDVKKYKLYAVIYKRYDAKKKPQYVVDKEATAKALAPIIGMKEEKVLERLNGKGYQVEFGSYGNNLSSLVKDKIEALDLPGLEFEELTTRNYRYGDFASYEVGYAQMANEKSTQYLVGQMGLEKAFNDQLAGKNGKKVYLADNHGYTLPNGVLSETEPVAGNDLYLTIDSDIQIELDLQMQKLAKEMKIDKGTCAVMEAKTGRILAISNYPSFDPNTRDMKNYTDLFFQEAIEPGSVFKSFVYANALSDGKLNVNEKYQSGKYSYKVNGKVVHDIKDHNKGKGWGTISYAEGFYHSSNTAICDILTKHSDRESLIKSFEELGLFQPSTIDGIQSSSGVAGYKGQKGITLEYLTTGFGQGSTVTGLQLLRGYSAFANDGKTVEPYLVEKIVNLQTDETIYQAKSKYSAQIYTTEAVKQMRDLLSGVVNSKGGTGAPYKMDDIHLIGKTGTGQVAKDGRYLSGYNTHGFVGLAPYDDPQIEIVVWYQNSIAGSTSVANLVKAVMRTAMNKMNTQPAKEIETSTYVLDSYTNQSQSYVKEILTSHQLTPIFVGDGKTVLSQYPMAKSEVSAKSRVFLQTNGSQITMPSMEGWSRKEAEAFASMANIDLEFDGIGSIYKQDVTSGKELKPHQKVKVYAK